MRGYREGVVLLGGLLVALAWACPGLGQVQFTDGAGVAGITQVHGYQFGSTGQPTTMAGGIAAADFDLDGDVDLYFETGDISPNALLRNEGNGTFSDVTNALGAGLPNHQGAGPAFADVTGDGYPELFIGGVEGSGLRVFRNLGGAGFEDMTAHSGLGVPVPFQHDFSMAFGDTDRDGDVDLFVAHWGFGLEANHFWENDGTGAFTAADHQRGLIDLQANAFSFTPNFVDLNGDGWLDLLIAADFNTSRVYLNDGSGGFTDQTDAGVITDENGMGAALADFNGDGHLDWFVTSIWDPNGVVEGGWGATGNRIYFGNGDGTFTDQTDYAGVREGYWGWGACAEDFDNDGWTDIFHVNGFAGGLLVFEFENDPSRLFMNQGAGQFQEVTLASGIDDTGQGRGVACFDFDADGDVDIFVANNQGPLRLFRNDTVNANGHVVMNFAGNAAADLTGAVVAVEAGGHTQSRPVVIGSNFSSQNPLRVHVGVGAATLAERVTVRWASGAISEFHNVAVGTELALTAPPAPPPNGPGSAIETVPSRGVFTALLTVLIGCSVLLRRQASTRV